MGLHNLHKDWKQESIPGGYAPTPAFLVLVGVCIRGVGQWTQTPPPHWMQTPPTGDLPPPTRVRHPMDHGSRPHWRQTPPPPDDGHVTCDACWEATPSVDRMTDRCKNFTLPQTSFAGCN